MGNFDKFVNQDFSGCEKLHGNYGCKYCKEDLDYAWWDRKNELFFWICSQGHRSEHKLQ